MIRQYGDPDQCRLWTPGEMQRADQNALREGISLRSLIDEAGRAVAVEISSRFPHAKRVAVLVGPGNNGRDALAAARYLREEKRSADLFGTANGHDEIAPLPAFHGGSYDLVLDGLWGAGLSRDVEGDAEDALRKAEDSGHPIVSIDIPSGVDGGNGQIRGYAPKVDLTVTFVRRKPGHCLLPGRDHCGTIVVAPIGLSETAMKEAAEPFEPVFANEPSLWLHHAATPLTAHHKYDRGHAVVFSGGMSRTGAARLAALSALRGGAGLVTVFSPASALLVNAQHLTGIMLKRCEDSDLDVLLEDKRLNAFVLGPGFGIGDRAKTMALTVLKAGRRLVLDADGLTSFRDHASQLFEAARQCSDSEPQLVLTPHDGEFARLFPDLAADLRLSKVDRARHASRRSNAIVVLKGADTVIAAPDGRAAINATGTPWLATAGTGDVLAGLVAAQLAQKRPSFEAACLAVWMHGKAAEHFGPGLISEDLPHCLPAVHREIVSLAMDNAH
ncbi:NAD(P)H-hydrate dehydratase [Aureimonas sp. D3]|uniref:NAD(P)H-hydrate dehydratase n=1 Tax=Aureimonas sp. D3 TaxID=1638164 RepID=UPI0009EA1BC4|nr:NAD(P)H-hydrate dehydratase [Aureimonas sp. D3]